MCGEPRLTVLLIVEPNLSADELDNEDGGEQGGAGDEAHNNSNNQAEAEAINREDTDLDSHSLERTLLLQRLNDATDKNFDAHSTPELRSIWKAYREDQEASEEIEVVYPQVTIFLHCTGLYTNIFNTLDPATRGVPSCRWWWLSAKS
jgi:hypothetical protein